jgi:hypothetical protein
MPWFEVDVDAARAIIHGKPLSDLLDESALVSRNDSAATPGASDYSAAVFSGETLIAIVEKACGNWKYGCVFNN